MSTHTFGGGGPELERIEVPFSWAGLFELVWMCGCLLAAGASGLAVMARHHAQVTWALGLPIGAYLVAGLLLPGAWGIGWVVRRSRSPAVVMDAEGVLDRARLGAPLWLPWEEISRVVIGKVGGMRRGRSVVFVVPRDAERVIASWSAPGRAFQRLGWKRLGFPAVAALGPLVAMPTEELAGLLARRAGLEVERVAR